MSTTFRCSVLAPMLMTVWATAALAQELPTSQPQVLVIYREQIKLGHDAAHLDGFSIIEAVAVPALSYGNFPDLNMARFWQITTFHIRPGHNAQFAEAVNVYKAVVGRTEPNARWRTYRVTNGMPDGTFLIYSSIESFGQFDAMMAGSAAIAAAMTPEEGEQMQKYLVEAVLSAITNRFRLDPDMSYVSDETKATDPDFWKINR